MALCPHCQKSITDITVADLPITTADGALWKGIVISCKNCDTLLTMGLDPVFYGGLFMGEIAKALKK
jgi:hypothetical protein